MKRAHEIRSFLAYAPFSALLPAGLAALSASLCSVLLLGASAFLIASAALHPPLYTLALAITLVRACGIGRAVFRYLDRWLSHRAVFRVQETLRLRLYEKAAALLPLKTAGARQAEFLHGLANGCDALRDFYLKSMLPPLLTLLLCLMGMTFLLPVAGFPSAILLPGLWLLHLLLPALTCKTNERELRETAVHYRDLLLDLREGCAELRAFGSTSVAAEKMHIAARGFTRRQEMQAHREDLVDTLLLLLRDIVLLLILFRLSLSVLAGGISGIELAVYLLALQTILAELSPLPDALRKGREGLEAARDILRSPGTIPPEPSGSPFPQTQTEGMPPLLSVRNLNFSYLPGLPVFREISFSLQEGERLAIVGESGCGKTTLGCLLTGLWQPESGGIALRGRDFSRLSPHEIRSAFAPCLQGEYVFSPSVRANFQYLHPDIAEEDIWQVLETAQLKEDIQNLPEKLDTPLGENACRLSGGQRQRLLVALALASSAPILLLDEPTAGLDKKTAHALMDGILSHLKGRALIIITHDMALADRMDAVYPMI